MSNSKHPYKRLKRSPNYKARRLKEDVCAVAIEEKLTPTQRSNGRKISYLFLGVSSVPYIAETYQKNYAPDRYLKYQEMFREAASAINIPYDAVFHRNYLASFLGAMALTSWASSVNLVFNEKATKKQSVVMPFTLMASSLTAWEALSARLPGRSFDWGDMACYAIALTAFTGLLHQGLKASSKPTDYQPKPNI